MNSKDRTFDGPSDAELHSTHRPIRSYVIRGGRLTAAQRKAIETHWSDYVVEPQNDYLDLDKIFPQKSAVTLEIGFGMGDSLLQMAQDSPSKNFLGVEVHMPGVGKLLQGIAAGKLNNLKVINHDAKEVIQNCLHDESLSRILIFFPDPWHKKKHNKRRLIQDEFVTLLASRLKPGGELHLATDWEPYAEHMLEVLDNCVELQNKIGVGQYSSAGDRPVTKFEKRGRKLGHGVWDLQYIKAK